MYGGDEECIQGLVGKSEGRALGTARGRQEVTIKMELQEVGWRGTWTGSSWLSTGTVEGCFECGNEPSGSTKHGEFLN